MKGKMFLVPTLGVTTDFKWTKPKEKEGAETELQKVYLKNTNTLFEKSRMWKC